MDTSALARSINTLSAVKAGTLRFWGDWFGKPHDNFHQVVRCSAVDASLVIEFDQGEQLTIHDPEGVTVNSEVFCIKNATLVRWEWFYYGRSRSAENRYFCEYVCDGSKITTSTNIDWYTPTFSPSVAESAVEIL